MIVTQTISEIKAQLALLDEENECVQQWRFDERKGVQQALRQFDRRLQKKAQLEAHFQMMMQMERERHQQGYRYVAGIDEVGRGPLAGPVVAAAVILPEDFHHVLVNDSKQLSASQRTELAAIIKQEAIAYGIGIMDETVIDNVNIYEATKLAMQQAIDSMAVTPDYLLLDAMQLDNGIPQESLIKGDARSAAIAAASIIAKVERDEMMVRYAEQYPGYDFEHNMGYGTAKHLAGLAKHGITKIHRKTFAPVKQYL